MSLPTDAMIRANLPLLRRLRAQDFESHGGLAERLGRDKSNLSKTLQKLRVEGLVRPDALGLTPAGEEALAALETESGAASPAAASNGEIPLALIDRDPDLNPRKVFNEDELAGLAASIKDKGVIQPVLLRPGPDFASLGRYLLVAGERRYRASLLAGMATINAIVRDLTDAQAREIALIENIQRVDLSPIEEARAFKAIVEARQAENPDLSQRAAAEVIVDATRKSLRFIEQRLQLLQLSEADQARMDLPEDDRQHLSVTEARKIMQKRPPKVEPAVLLVLAELAIADDLAEAHAIVDDVAMLADPNWEGLRNGYLVTGPHKVYASNGGDWTGGFYAYTGYSGDNLLRGYCPQFWDEDTTARDAFVADLRRQVLGYDLPTGIYATAWLNGPFPLTEEREAEVAEHLAEVKQRAADALARDQQIAATRAAQRQVGEAALEKAQQLTLAMRAAPPPPIAPLLPETLAQIGYALPFTIKGDALLDAKGQFLVALRNGYGGLNLSQTATLQLVADAINGACGLATPEPDDGQAKTTEQFTAWLAERFLTMHQANQKSAAENAAKALARVLESEQIGFGDPDFDWSEEAAQHIADGWAEDGGDQAAEETQLEEAE